MRYMFYFVFPLLTINREYSFLAQRPQDVTNNFYKLLQI